MADPPRENNQSAQAPARYGLTLLTLLFTFFSLCITSPIIAQQERAATQRFITIDFDNVDITLFIKYISELTGKNFVVDPSVKGQVTIISPTRISEQDAYRVFESVLEVHGYTTVPAGSVTKIVPLVAARAENVATFGPDSQFDPEDRIVTRLVPLRHTTPDEVQRVLQPLIAKTSVMVGHTPSGLLIITDTSANIRRLLSIIEELDVEYRREDVEVVSLEHGDVAKVAAILDAIFTRSGPGAAEGEMVRPRVAVIPYERINALVIMAEPTSIERVKGLIDRLDVEIEQGEGNIHVVYLQNATATELAKVLTALPRQADDQEGEARTAAMSEEVTIMADEETNALIVTASREEFRVLESVIEQLDIPRQMVYLEALIMEVDVEKNFEVGVQWFGADEINDGAGFAFGAFSDDSEFADLEGITDPETPILPAGLSLGVLREGIEIGGITFPNIAAILRAFKSDEDINIIATPQILTTDNKKAEIKVGENIPYITSQNTTASQQDYTQFEYRDVATRLTITPHIGQADTLRLEIETEVIKPKGQEESLTPTTFVRTARTTVIVEDSTTIVIGGIIGQDGIENEQKVPLLGDIPLLGWLFKTRATQELRTNLFIFITPRIVSNPAEIARVTMEREDRLGPALQAAKAELYPPPDPRQAARLTDIGVSRLAAGRFIDASSYFRQALDIDPDNLFALINLGVALEKSGDFPGAIAAYRKVVAEGSGSSSSASSHLIEIATENIAHARRLMANQ